MGDLAGRIEDDPKDVSTLAEIVDRALCVSNAGNEGPGL